MQEQAASLPDDIEIECHLGIPGVEIEIDSSSIQRVLVNLLSNASEAMVGKGDTPVSTPTENPKIIVLTQRSERGVELHVIDNGPGIPADLLEKVREPLFTTKNFGVGLGLAAVDKVLQQHGGGLEIRSVEGEGTTVTAWLPVEAKPQVDPTSSHGPTAGSFLAA